MNKLGIFIGEDIWTFFDDIYDDLSRYYQIDVYQQKTVSTPVFHGRINRWLMRHKVTSMLQKNDICFFEWASDLLAYASQFKKECAVVTRMHSFELYEWAPKINWDFVDKVILISHAMEQQFIKLYPEQSSKTVVVYNGRPLDGFAPPVQRDFKFVLGMLSNIKPIKRIYSVVLMLYELRKMGYDAQLRIAGKPSSPGDLRYAASIYRLVDKLNLKDSVHFDGYVKNTSDWLKETDIFISNSYWEGQQVALIEAMATGCYCLSHFWNGANEMLPEENLYISENDLKKKIIEYSKLSESEKTQRQIHLREMACEKFNVEQTKAGIRHVIDDLVMTR